MKKRIRSGDVFGRLTAIKPLEEKPFWKFKCSCGKTKKIRSYDVLYGKVKSCSCLLAETTKARMQTLLVTHNMSKTPLYGIWRGMKKRCSNTNAPYYKNYGGRGIKVCKRWRGSFENFYTDMGEEYKNHVNLHGKKNTSLERIDVNKGYFKGNCAFTTREKQANNKRNSVLVRAENKVTGEILIDVSIKYFCEKKGFKVSGARYALDHCIYKKEWILTKTSGK